MSGGAGDVVVRTAAVGRDSAALAALRWAWAVEKGEVAGERGSVDPEFAERFALWVAANARTHAAFLAGRVDGTGGNGGTGDPVGMAWLVTVERVPDVTRPVRRAGLVQSVFVLPEHRDAGIGGLLLAALLDTARGRSLDYLLVSPSARSVPFYRRLGFAGDDRLSLRLT